MVLGQCGPFRQPECPHFEAQTGPAAIAAAGSIGMVWNASLVTVTSEQSIETDPPLKTNASPALSHERREQDRCRQ